jgi:hypothetical protein
MGPLSHPIQRLSDQSLARSTIDSVATCERRRPKTFVQLRFGPGDGTFVFAHEVNDEGSTTKGTINEQSADQ